MKPMSAGYYITHNRSRAGILMFMMFLTTGMLVIGNYLSSFWWFCEEAETIKDGIVTVGALPTDEDMTDWNSFLEDLERDGDLIVMRRTGRGFRNEAIRSTLGFDMGAASSYVWNSREDMQRACDLLGIRCDCSAAESGSCFLSEKMADNLGLAVGDTLKNSPFRYAGQAEGAGFVVFYLYEDSEDKLGRANIMSERISGDELRARISEIAGDRKIQIVSDPVGWVKDQLGMVKLLFFPASILIAIVLAVTLNSVLTGQFLRREYEFAVYRALGVSRRTIRRKVTSELVLMDLIAVAAGLTVMLLLTFLLNELLYVPRGQYLPYVSGMGVFGLAVSNLALLVPACILKGRKMCRMDVTDF